MIDMSIKEFAKCKKDLEVSLTKLLKEFEETTGLPIEDIEYACEFPPRLGEHNKQVTIDISLNKLLGDSY